MDRLKLETAYLRAFDALMSTVDERQLQAATLRLRRAQARLHGTRKQGSPARRGPRPGLAAAGAGRRPPAFRHLPQAAGLQGQ
jgi:hypothetical protein